jgi:hypothetical protein
MKQTGLPRRFAPRNDEVGGMLVLWRLDFMGLAPVEKGK